MANDIIFKPMLTPKEILKEGAFGGNYFSGDEERLDLKAWFPDINEELYISKKYDKNKNKFKVLSGVSLKKWIESGWIHDADPKGWFEWYCKYYYGRRHEDDRRQIKRWSDFCGDNGRWRSNIYKKIHNSGLKVSSCDNVSPKIQQSLLHWSYMVNEKDFSTGKKQNSV